MPFCCCIFNICLVTIPAFCCPSRHFVDDTYTHTWPVRTRGLCAHVACAHTWPVRTRGLCAHVACAHTWPVRTRGLCAHVACAHTWPVRTRGLCAHVACAHTWPVRMLTFNIDKNTLYTWQFKGPSITYVTHGGGGCASQTWGVLVSVTERNMGTWGCLGDPY